MTTAILIPNVELSFEKLFEPQGMQSDPNSKPRYSVTLLLDPAVHAAALAKIQARIKFLISTEKAWAAGVPPTMQYCVSDGDYNAKAKGWSNYAGKKVISTASPQDKPPTLLGPGRVPAKNDGRLIYSGAICNVIIELWAQTGKHGRHGINAQVLVVQGTGHGQHVGGGGRTATAEDLDQLPEIEDPMAINTGELSADPATSYTPDVSEIPAQSAVTQAADPLASIFE